MLFYIVGSSDFFSLLHWQFWPLVSVVYWRRILYCHNLCEFKVLMVMIEEYCLLVCKMCGLVDRYQCFGGI